MTVINTNIGATIARNAIGTNERSMATSMERLSTGLRINSAKDDAAGLAIASRMTAQVSTLNMGVRNANDAISMLQTVEGASKEISNMLVRMKELAVQANSETYSKTDTDALDLEYQALEAEIVRVQEKTTWNSMALMDHATPGTANTVSVQLGDSAKNSNNQRLVGYKRAFKRACIKKHNRCRSSCRNGRSDGCDYCFRCSDNFSNN